MIFFSFQTNDHCAKLENDARLLNELRERADMRIEDFSTPLLIRKFRTQQLGEVGLEDP